MKIDTKALQAYLSNPEVARVLMGGGIGGAIGLGRSLVSKDDRKNWLHRLLTHTAIGGLGAYGVGKWYDSYARPSTPPVVSRQPQPPKQAIPASTPGMPTNSIKKQQVKEMDPVTDAIFKSILAKDAIIEAAKHEWENRKLGK